jgi:acetyltransferase-like isoleucine patch superfamily enzyme
MNGEIAHLLGKIGRHRHARLSELASKALRYATETTCARLALRSCDAVGPGARSRGWPIVRNLGEIRIGKDLSLICQWSPVELAARPGGTLTIGDNVLINHGTLVSASNRVTIGDQVMIGNYCIVADSEVPGTVDRAAPADATRDSFASESRPVDIGHGAWLSVRVTVLPGARIGAGAVITAGSIVEGDIPPGVVAGGIPARAFMAAPTASDKTRPRSRPPP